MRLLLPLLLFIPTTALAQNFTTALEADLTGDGLIDRAELYETREGGDADMNIWVRQPDGSLDLHTKAEAIVWVGGIGQYPSLAVSKHGSLLLTSMNESIGRDRWHQTLTLAWRDNTFVLAGYTYEWYDTLNLSDAGKCDVNLLNGKGEMSWGEEFKHKTSFRTKSRGGPIDRWDHYPPKECSTD